MKWLVMLFVALPPYITTVDFKSSSQYVIMCRISALNQGMLQKIVHDYLEITVVLYLVPHFQRYSFFIEWLT